jgi:transaldolase
MSGAINDKKTTSTKLNQLEQIKKFTTVVADTADFESIREFKPQDATTNPSLVYAATQKANYSHFLEEVLVDRRNSGLWGAAQMEDFIDHLLVRFGCAMLAIVPGRVSTETDARFSFDVQGSIRKAQRLVKLYEEQGIGRERVLMGRDHGGGTTAEERDQVQYDTPLLASAGRACCGSEGATHFAIRGTDLRLV